MKQIILMLTILAGVTANASDLNCSLVVFQNEKPYMSDPILFEAFGDPYSRQVKAQGVRFLVTEFPGTGRLVFQATEILSSRTVFVGALAIPVSTTSFLLPNGKTASLNCGKVTN